MPCPHYKIKISSRRKGHSAVAQAAYQSGERLFDERTKRTKSYSEKRGIVYTEIMLPENAPPEYADRNTLWNAVEAAENNWNSQLARRFEIALPVELTMEQNIMLIKEHCMEQFVSKGMIADIAIHDPEPPGHNPHAHVMLTMRPMDEQGKWMEKAHREYILDENGNRIKDAKGKWKFRKIPTVDWNARGNAEVWRHAWEVTQNKYLEAAGIDVRISMMSYERQGIDQIPKLHMGPAVTAMERRGVKTFIGNINRDIEKINELIALLVRIIKELIAKIKEIGNAISELEIQPEEIPLIDLVILSFKESIRDEHGKMSTTVGEAERFESVVDYLRENNIVTFEDLEERLDAMSKDTFPEKEELRKVKNQIRSIEGILEHGDLRENLNPIHEEYMNIRWKGKKEKFSKEHADELEAWKAADKYMRKNLPDQDYKREELVSELSTLYSEFNSLREILEPRQEEARMLNEISSLITELLPELVPEDEPLTPKRRQEKMASIRDRLEKAKVDADKRADDYLNRRKTREERDAR